MAPIAKSSGAAARSLNAQKRDLSPAQVALRLMDACRCPPYLRRRSGERHDTIRHRPGSVTDPLLDTAIRAALAAGEAIMRVYAEPFEVIQKSDQTPVTEADLAAERVIVKMLTEAFPDIPIVSEATAPDDGVQPPAARFWCVDPPD